VVALLTAIAILSLADLYMTLTHVMSFGMLEQNPVARMSSSTRPGSAAARSAGVG